MRLPRRRETVGVALLAVLGTAALLLRHGTTDWTEGRRLPDGDGFEYVPVGSLLQTKNGSQFQLALGLDPYPWHFFHISRWQRQVMAPGAGDVQRPPRPGLETDELGAVLRAALQEVRRATGNEAYVAADSLGGRYRLLPGAGVQYEVYYRARGPTERGFHTVRLERPLAALAARYAGRAGGQLVNIVLPYYNRLAALKRFVGRFAELARAGQQLVLTVVRYTDGFPSMEAEEQRRDRDGVVAQIDQANRRIGGAEPRIRLVEKQARFSRGAALMEGARAWNAPEDVILFLCDVDIVFGKNFLQRCRANTQPAEKAYFPIVFSSYNPDIVYGVIKKKVVPVLTNYQRKTLINKELGFWIDFGFGMSCQYLSDFRRLSGDFLNITGWGLEDVKLYEQFEKSSVEIVRMPDPDLVHVYHKKQCSKYEVGKRFNSCLKSKALNEASRLQWGLWVYKNMGDTDDVEEFLRVFRGNQASGG